MAGTFIPTTNLDLFKGIVRYTDKAGVQHAMETATNLSTLNEVRSALNTIKTNLERQGFIVNAADVVDVLNDVVGGTGAAFPERLTDAWHNYESPLSSIGSSKPVSAFCRYSDVNGRLITKCIGSCASRAEALNKLNEFVTTLNGAGTNILNTCITDDDSIGTNFDNIFGLITTDIK